MKDNKEIFENFELKTNNLLESLKEFGPTIHSLKELCEAEITDEQKLIVDQFTDEAKGATDIDSLIKLKEKYLQKLSNDNKIL